MSMPMLIWPNSLVISFFCWSKVTTMIVLLMAKQSPSTSDSNSPKSKL